MSNQEIVKESGLRITVLNPGEGPNPVSGQTVLIHYELWLNRGTTSSNYDYVREDYVDDIYDNTYDENNPYNGPIQIQIGSQTPKDEVYSKGQSIKGLDEALLEMKVGAKCALLIPPELAYGEEGASSFHTFHGYRTPPQQTIRCNVELVTIKQDSGDKIDVDRGTAYVG